ncbi:MAG: YaaR family protein [Clostridiaceae bacterium]|nr:YaaR family protein [Clostridiaceae bacterium]
MKINEVINHLSGIQSKQVAEDKKLSDTAKLSFDEQLIKAEEQDYRKRLTELLDQVNRQGERLSKNIDIKELKRYRKLISEFLYEAVRYSHKFSKESMLDRRGRYKVYAMIHKVDEHLDNLTREVLMEERNNVKILQRLDDIRGLLLDILM